MNIKFVGVAVVIAIATGCASVPMESPEADRTAKEFRTPEGEKAGLYIYRAAGIGTALKKDIWVDGECIGESAPQIFFYTEVDGDQTHTVSTESEFSPNNLEVATASGKNFFVEQYMKIGVFVGGANLRLVDPVVGKAAVNKLTLAKKGNCSKDMSN